VNATLHQRVRIGLRRPEDPAWAPSGLDLRHFLDDLLMASGKLDALTDHRSQLAHEAEGDKVAGAKLRGHGSIQQQHRS
jgi:hypothetical protein